MLMATITGSFGMSKEASAQTLNDKNSGVVIWQYGKLRSGGNDHFLAAIFFGQ